jgi:hypothetical protein
MVFVSLLGVSDLFSIMSDYSDGVYDAVDVVR